MRDIVNPLQLLEQIATASAAEKAEQAETLATASALTNMNPSICPKCGATMGKAFLFDRTQVFYCDVDRVTQPME
ncbi:hypothetical protein D3C80_283370 [compost metagenome]